MSNVLKFIRVHDREIVFLAGAVFAIALWYVATWIASLFDERRRKQRMMAGKKEG